LNFNGKGRKNIKEIEMPKLPKSSNILNDLSTTKNTVNDNQSIDYEEENSKIENFKNCNRGN